MNILLVDDSKSNLEVLNLHIENWFEEYNFDIDSVIIDNAYNGKEALDMILNNKYYLVFLDIMMPIMTGIETLDHLSHSAIATLPHIVIQTALDSSDIKIQAKALGACAYITKPVKYEAIEAMLDRYLAKFLSKYEVDENTNFDEFDEFSDFDEFEDFEDFEDFESNEIDEQKDMMDSFNKSHKKISATEFLQDYPDLEYIIEDIEDIDHNLFEIIDILDEDNLVDNIYMIEGVLSGYSTFLNTFLDFYELSTSLTILTKILLNSDIESLDQKSRKFIAELIIAVLKDLRDWKDHVFIDQDAIDVFYINASSLSTCIQLESYIKKKLN